MCDVKTRCFSNEIYTFDDNKCCFIITEHRTSKFIMTNEYDIKA